MSQQAEKSKGARIHAQLAAIMTAVDAVGKDRRNSGQGFQYRGIEDVMDALHPIFAEHKVFVLSEVMDEKTEERTTAKGGSLIYRVLKVKVSYVSGEDGSRESVTVVGEGMDSGDKAANKAMSAALKYALTQTLILPYGQVDGDASTPPDSKPDSKPDPHQELIERMAADGISNIEMVRYCQGKQFLAANAGPNNLTGLAPPLLRKMLAPENWKQVLGVIETMRPKADDAASPKPPNKQEAASDQASFNTRLYDMMALAGISEEQLAAYLRKRGLMTATQSIHNLSEKFVNTMLDGADKATGKNNFALIADNIRKARAA